ncbi:gelation factor, putative [Acanthamoeba castellanii str. Neff]|uniref:Gelation factor, putative n=1 Tax=Acanthamoeba castellanii (strain ATCC 30010 / Neff) TaxID=1257118 RepID=L8HJ20_ACACF|nr:gelation factor, putative [Acanthamoeba castellanii str. Neff]ELR24683.1 gelation factor, putative [Acanthamoeba castellanii str. Neff]
MAQQQHAVSPADKTWVDVQKKAFTRWANQFLAERRMKVEDIETGLSNGINLCNLLEIISSKSLGKINLKPTMRYHYLENNGRAVKFIKDEGLQLVGIGPEDIVDGKVKLILGLIWTLILRYQINMIGQGSPKWELLQWVNAQIAPYNVDKPVVNFTTNWCDGRVLSALCDSVQPGVLTPTDMSALTNDALQDLEKAMQTALDHFNIARLIDPEDMVNTPDELSLMTYLSAFRNYLSEEEHRKREELARKKRTADPAHCYAYGPGLERADTYQSADFTIVAKNYFDEELPTGGDQFEVTIAGPEGHIQPTVTDGGDGKYPVHYTVTKPGDYTITIKLRDEAIKNSPYTVHIDGPSAGHSVATGPGVEGAQTKKPAQFRVTSFNAQGQQIKTGGDKYEVQVEGPEAVPAPSLTDNQDGTFDGAYQVATPGRYVVKVTLDGEPIKGSPYGLLIEGARAALSFAEGPGLVGGQTTKPGVFTIHAYSPDGDRCTDGGDPFQVDIQGPAQVQPSITDNADGTYTVQYTPTEPGDYQVNVTLHGEPIKESPVTVFIKSSPDAGKSWAEGTGLVALVDTDMGHFVIHAVDKAGVQRTDGGDQFEVAIAAPNGDLPATVTDNGDGTYAVQFEPIVPGQYTIAVTFEGGAIQGAPFTVPCTEGTDYSASGFGVFSFTIQARDRRGDKKTFGGDKFTVDIAGPTGDASEVGEVQTNDNGDGTYTAVYALAGQKGDIFTILAKLNGHGVGTYKQNM